MRRWSREDIELVRAGFHDSAKVLDEALGLLVDDAKTLGRRGWTVPMLQLPEFTMLVVRTVPAIETDAFFLDFYRRNTESEFRALADHLLRQPKLANWRPLLEECVDTYRREAFLVTVPSLLTVFDGALATIVDRPNELQPRTLATNEFVSAEDNIERVPWASIDAFTQTVFGIAAFGGNRPALINRHWILHGRDTPEWTQADCLRLFQAVHTLGCSRTAKRQDWLSGIRDPVLREYLRRNDLNE